MSWYLVYIPVIRLVSPLFRPSDPALCGSCPLVTPYYCRLWDLLYIICVVSFLLIIVHVYLCVKLFTFFYLYFVDFLQYSDTVGWVFWPVKTFGRMTYIVSAQTLNHAQPTNQVSWKCCNHNHHSIMLQINVDTKNSRDRMSRLLRSSLANNCDIQALRQFVVRLPEESQHTNHYIGPVSCFL